MEKLSTNLRALFKKFRATKFRTMEIDDNVMSIRAVKKEGATIVDCNLPVVKSANSSSTYNENSENQAMVRKPSLPSVHADSILESEAVTPHTILSTRVGHFYLRDPKKLVEAVLTVGSKIQDGDIIGFIESMNVRHEVKAEMGGVVSSTLVEDGEAVEYGQPLARFEKSVPAEVKKGATGNV